jgi:hypothetical protein
MWIATPNTSQDTMSRCGVLSILSFVAGIIMGSVLFERIHSVPVVNIVHPSHIGTVNTIVLKIMYTNPRTLKAWGKDA